MPAWSELLDELNTIEPEGRGSFLAEKSLNFTARIAHRYQRNVLFYAVGNRPFSAHSIVDQFEEAKTNIASNPVLAHAWAPVLSSFGPALLQEARKAISYGQSLVQNWLQEYMFADTQNPAVLAEQAAEYFGSDKHGSHGKRIDREEAKLKHIKIIALEDDQDLQEEILSLYHLSTIAFEQGPAAKTVMSSNGRMWVKNMQMEMVVQTPNST